MKSIRIISFASVILAGLLLFMGSQQLSGYMLTARVSARDSAKVYCDNRSWEVLDFTHQEGVYTLKIRSGQLIWNLVYSGGHPDLNLFEWLKERGFVAGEKKAVVKFKCSEEFPENESLGYKDSDYLWVNTWSVD